MGRIFPAKKRQCPCEHCRPTTRKFCPLANHSRALCRTIGVVGSEKLFRVPALAVDHKPQNLLQSTYHGERSEGIWRTRLAADVAHVEMNRVNRNPKFVGHDFPGRATFQNGEDLLFAGRELKTLRRLRQLRRYRDCARDIFHGADCGWLPRQNRCRQDRQPRSRRFAGTCKFS